MSTLPPDADVLLIGAGGVGAPAGLALSASGVRSLIVLDDDRVDVGNLHRQICFDEADVGELKAPALARALERRAPGLRCEAVVGRALPETARQLMGRARVVVDGTDNFASRFLIADACFLEGTPVVHAAAVRWRGTLFVGGGPSGRPCYRCLFEDLPEGPAPDCASAGVIGPLCGVIGALAADAAVRLLQGDRTLAGTVASFDAKRRAFRRVAVRPRPSCPLCGEAPSIGDLDRGRYLAPACEWG